MNRHMKASALGLISGVFLVMSFSATASAYDVMCWDASRYDRDGDGYASVFAPKSARQRVEADLSERLTCPSGWVLLGGDCNDSDASIHPRRPEVYGNVRDDNCNGLIDEPEFQYDQTGWWNTRNSLYLVVTVNSRGNYQDFEDDNLYYRLEYQDLTDTSKTMSTKYYAVDWIHSANDPDGKPIKVMGLKLDGLKEATVYRVRIQFFTIYHYWDGLEATGSKSKWYYSATEASDATEQARISAVLFALSEYYQSQIRGERGYLAPDTPDGSEYGVHTGAPWDAAFYHHVVSPFVNGMYSGFYSDLVKYFQRFDTYKNKLIAVYLSDTRAGEFLDYNASMNDYQNSTAMMLAYDKSTNCFHTVEANMENQVQILERCDSNLVKGLGWFSYRMVTVP